MIIDEKRKVYRHEHTYAEIITNPFCESHG